MSYNRKKRMFCKLIIEQFKTIQDKPPSNDYRYAKEHRKLREFSEQLFLACGKAEHLKPSDVALAMIISADRSPVSPMFTYVGHLAISALTGGTSKAVSGSFVCSNCSGDYTRHGNNYVCDTCGYIGKADQYGFPVSLPANKSVRALRRRFHSLINSIRSHGLSMQDSYTLVSFESNVPLPLVHAGLCVTENQMERLINGCENVLKNIPKGS